MAEIKELIHREAGFHLHVIPTKKYKTTTIVVKLQAPLEKNTVTERSLLSLVLQQGTVNHPSARQLRQSLDDLYGAILSVDSSKKGENHLLTFRMEIVNEKFLKDPTPLLEKGLELLSEVILKPKHENNAFDPLIVKREKDNLTKKIQSIKDDKMSYANMRLMDYMCKDEAYATHVHGYLEDLEQINEKSLFEYYQKMLKTNRMDVYILGDLEEEQVKNYATTYFKHEQTNETNPIQSQQISVQESKEIVEEDTIQQGKLHMGFRSNVTFKDNDYFALQIFNGLFGGFPHSKLFINVREKNSLAYYAASRFESHKGLLLVFSGIDPNNYKKAKDIILNQLEAMKKGDFSDSDVEETKDLVINQLLETMDNQHGLIEVLYHQVLSGSSMKPAEMLSKLKAVTKDDVLKVANKIELDTIYFLTNKEGGNADEN